MLHLHHRVLVLALALACGCSAQPQGDSGDDSIGGTDDMGSPDGAVVMMAPGITARVTADALNLRDGVGTGANILTSMPCGSAVQVVDGPSTTPVTGWWQVTYMGQNMSQTGWASGKYLVPDATFDPTVCMMTPPPPPSNPTVDAIFTRAKQGVGYSYYWGHGSWRSDGASPGSCTGSCPSCSHSGQYGADCSGFVAKCWQIPSPSPLEQDLHPYSTYNFYNQTTHWSKVPRSSLQPADALVYNNGTSGHIVLVESATDPYGSIWLYEARGCSTGVVHNLRTIDSKFIAIRLQGL